MNAVRQPILPEGESLTLPEPRPWLTPAADAPDWLLIIRATWCDGQVQLDALREVVRRKLLLAASLPSHDRLLEEFTARAFATRGSR
jgi:hypothetical protein